MAQPSQNPERNELTITRVFDAPRERVWQAWTEPEFLKRWNGPTGCGACLPDRPARGRRLSLLYAIARGRGSGVARLCLNSHPQGRQAHPKRAFPVEGS